jgi:hypothetical protein
VCVGGGGGMEGWKRRSVEERQDREYGWGERVSRQAVVHRPSLLA